MTIHGLTPPSDDRPDWARMLRLPRRETLTYTQAVLVTGALAFVAVYMATRTMRNPRAVLKAARVKTGV